MLEPQSLHLCSNCFELLKKTIKIVGLWGPMICTPKTCKQIIIRNWDLEVVSNIWNNLLCNVFDKSFSIFSDYIEFSKIQSVYIWLGAIGVSTICNLIRPKYHAKYPKLFGSQFTCHKLFSTNGSADDIKNDSPYSL